MGDERDAVVFNQEIHEDTRRHPVVEFVEQGSSSRVVGFPEPLSTTTVLRATNQVDDHELTLCVDVPDLEVGEDAAHQVARTAVMVDT